MMDWYYTANGERKGPVDTEAVKALVHDGTLKKDSLVWNQSMGEKWAKVSEVPILAGPSTVPEDPKAKQAFLQKLEERRQIADRQRHGRLLLALVTGAAALLLIVGIAAFIKAKPLRQWGISSDHPLGTVAKLEARLLGDYQMEKASLTQSPSEINRSAAQIVQYSKPKCPRGEHVGEGGPVTLFLDDHGEVRAMLATFPSPGQRGPFMVNRSITCNFMNELWHAHGGPKEPPTETRPRDTGGLTFKPPDGYYFTLEDSSMRCIWVEFGLYTVSSLVYLEAK